MKYCLFMGTFNPIHNAHLKLAEKVKTTFNFDKIIFIPAFIQPFKSHDICVNSANHRYSMLEIALKHYPYFELSNIEFQKGNTSYTIETIEILYKTLPDIQGKINLILGSDTFVNINKWHRANELIGLVNFIVLQRNEDKIPDNIFFDKVSYNILKNKCIDISSTQIRNMVKSNEDILNLVPMEVEKYINDNKLYRN